MGTYTPGPWRLRRSDLAVVNADASTLIAWTDRNTYGKTRDDIQANARLIAAAPDLLETIKAFVMATTAIHSDITFYPAGGSTNNPDEDGVDLRDYARAIITKAEGR